MTRGVPQGSILGPMMFIIYIDDLPEEISDIPAFGYADDFKAFTHGEHECESTRGNIEMEQSKTEVDLNVSKSKTLLIRGDLAERDEAGLETVVSQKGLGVVMSRNLPWSASCQRRTTKAWKAFQTLKQNVSSGTSMETKLNAYIGYVVPVLTYASQFWYPSKADMRSIEKIEGHEVDMRWKRRIASKTRNTENTPTLHVHGNARCPLSPLNPRRQLLRPRKQMAISKRKRNKTKAGV